VLIFPERDEAGMPQVIIRGPFHILELPDVLRLQPAALLDLLHGESLAPAPAPRFRQVGERTFGSLHGLKAPMQPRSALAHCVGHILNQQVRPSPRVSAIPALRFWDGWAFGRPSCSV
jgi:hypothetical protein